MFCLQFFVFKKSKNEKALEKTKQNDLSEKVKMFICCIKADVDDNVRFVEVQMALADSVDIFRTIKKCHSSKYIRFKKP